MSAPAPATTSLLLDVGVPFRVIDSRVYLESQAHHGVRCWLDNFDRLTLCAAVIPDHYLDKSMGWTSADDLLREGRFTPVLLPCAYDAPSHFRHVAGVRRKMRALIPGHSHLCFSNHGWLGAWGRIGAEEAQRLGRPYAVWLDWALHDMPIRPTTNPVKRLWRRVQSSANRRHVFRAVQRASLGLFNGRTVYDAYSSSCRVPRVAYDIHLAADQIIAGSQLQDRLLRSSGPLKIIYVGRVHDMKGPKLWVEALEQAFRQLGPDQKVEASWIGDGPLLTEMRSEVEARGLGNRIRFEGPEMDRARLLARMRDADLFVFCHVTPESPRCLIEALMSGLPIVGFDSAYARDLLGDHGLGGDLVPVRDSPALAAAVVRCLSEPVRRRGMSEAARAAGGRFSDASVFKHRSDLIKQYVTS